MDLVTAYLESLGEEYSSLNVIKQNDTYTIYGTIKLNHIYDDVRMTGSFDLEIEIASDFPNTLPVVREVSEQIDRKYPHISADGKFCLASNIELKRYFHRNKDIGRFIDDYIIPYLYTYCYHREYDVYPYGERSHGIMGDLEYLKEILMVDDWCQVYDIMAFICMNKYRGHLACPCGSGKRLRNCHGDIIKEIIMCEMVDYCREILKKVVERMNKEYEKDNYDDRTI